MAKKKIDPLNKKAYGAVSAALTVSDIPAAVSFYQRAFGFAKRGIMNGPDAKPIHAELTLRGATLMLGPENPAMGRRGPVMDMFWGDRCGTIVDPDGCTWMVGTHKAEPTAKEMKKGMLEMMKTMKQHPGSAAAAD